MCVPTETTLDTLATLSLVTSYKVLDVPGEQVAIVRQTVSERRAVIEDELVTFTLVNGGLESIVVLPVFQYPLFQVWEARRGRG